MADYNIGPFRMRPRGEYNKDTVYRFFDNVLYRGTSYCNINPDSNDDDSCIGIPPEGAERSEVYWLPVALRGEKGETGDAYQSFVEVRNGSWDYNVSDKIYIPEDATEKIDILNVYNGCCGTIITKLDLAVPTNSDKAFDYNFVTAGVNQYYMYTFVYGHLPPFSTKDKFLWHRTVINSL